MNKANSNLFKEINSINNLFDILNKINNNGNTYFYRGMNNNSFTLLPKLFRHRTNNNLNESQIIRDILRKIPQNNLLLKFKYPADILDILIVLQHYSIPTRLLDWSLNPLVALYFACLENKDKTDGAYFILNSTNNFWKKNISQLINDNTEVKNNTEINLKEFIINPPINDIFALISACLSLLNDPDKDYDFFKFISNFMQKYYDINFEIIFETNKFSTINFDNLFDKPFPLITNFNNERIHAQQGVFTIHGFNKKSIEDQLTDIENSDDVFMKFVIPYKSKQKILNELACLGITHHTIFPDFEGINKSIEESGFIYPI